MCLVKNFNSPSSNLTYLNKFSQIIKYYMKNSKKKDFKIKIIVCALSFYKE